jgi:hypothetical protein
VLNLSRKLIIGAVCIMVAILTLIIGGLIIMISADMQELNDTEGLLVPTQDINDVEGLLVPTQEEARYMVNQFPDLDGGGPSPVFIFPFNYDMDLARALGLATDGTFSREYLNMQALYRKALEHYLAERLNLVEFDEMLSSSELDFIPLSEDRFDFYQRYSTFGFQYIYLRNNLPIERLSPDDLDILRRYIHAGNSNVTEELLDLVARTFKRVITVDEGWEPDVPAGYHPGGDTAPNNALVLIIGLHRGGGGKERAFLDQEFIPMMEGVLSEKLGIPVVVFRYRI